MWFLRLLAILTLLVVAGSVLAYLVTRKQVYVVFAWRVFRYAIFIALAIFGLLILERVAIIPL